MDHAAPVEPPRPGLSRGGSRNRRERISWQLSAHDCRKLIAGADAAWDRGMPFTRFITWAWELGGIAPTETGRVTGQFIDLARDWLAARGHRLPWAWTRETGNTYGAHAHGLLSVPVELDPLFRPMPRRWAKHLLGGVYVPGVVKCESLYFRKAAFSNPDAYWAQVQGKLHYMLKCAPAELEAELGTTGWGEVPWGQRCKVQGKRAGVWQYRQG